MAPGPTTVGPWGSNRILRYARSAPNAIEESDPVREATRAQRAAQPTPSPPVASAVRRPAGPRPPARPARRPRWRSPTVLITIAAVVVALAVIAILNNRPGRPPGPGATGSAAPAGAAARNVAVIAPGSPLPDGVARDGRTLGASTAKVTLDVWEDFQCPACGNFTNQIEPVAHRPLRGPGPAQDHVPRLRVPRPGVAGRGVGRPVRRRAGQVLGRSTTTCSPTRTVRTRAGSRRDRFVSIAERIGLDMPAFEACYDGGSQRPAVTTETQAGRPPASAPRRP